MAQYSIEIAGPKNEVVIFAPTQERLRGAWNFANTAHLNVTNGPAGDWLRGLMTKIRRIPGLIIVVDDEKKQAAIIDPLGTPEYAETLAAMNATFKAHGAPSEFSEGTKPRETQKFALDFDGVKLWMYWMRRLLDGNLAVLCAGSAQLPTTEEIDRRPGRRRRDPMNTYEQSAQSAEEARKGDFGLYPWTAEVPIPKGEKQPA